MLDYLETTWAVAAEYVAEGHSVGEAMTDPRQPRYTESHAQCLHGANIGVMYCQSATNKENNL